MFFILIRTYTDTRSFRSIIKRTHSSFSSINEVVKDDDIAWFNFAFQTSGSGCRDNMRNVQQLEGMNVGTIVDIAR